jgi:class 3 adenylate cyclase
MSLDPAGGIAIHVTAKLAYHECVAESVARFEGFVAKYIGDGVPT